LWVLIFCWSPLAGQIQIHAVTTGAGYLPGITRPGGISTIFCAGLTGLAGGTEARTAPLPNELAGVRVRVNNVGAPLLAVADLGSYQQVNFLVPNLPDFTRAPITITLAQSGRVHGVKLEDSPFNGYPADFFRDAAGYGIIQRAADYSLVTPQNPARRGEIVIVYATGMGAVEPPVPAGAAAPLQPLSPLILYPGEIEAVRVFLCQPGAPCEPTVVTYTTPSLFAGLSPGSPGLYQINFRIPETAPAGDVELGIVRTYCYDAPCTIQSPFQQNFISERVKIPIE